MMNVHCMSIHQVLHQPKLQLGSLFCCLVRSFPCCGDLFYYNGEGFGVTLSEIDLSTVVRFFHSWIS